VSELLTLEQALASVLERVGPLAAEAVSIADAGGRVAAASALSVSDLPPFPSSAMDGFAVRSRDLPGTLTVVGEAAAGSPAERLLGSGETIAISTGGVVPDGADAVVPIEFVVTGDNEVEFPEAVPPGTNIRPRGGDLAAGDVVVGAGSRIGPAQIGALAAAGVPEVACTRRPRVVVVVTGSELAPPGAPLGPGQVYEANGVMLAAALAASGALVERLPAVADDHESHRRAIERGLAADVLVTSGGVSVGPHDLVRRVERELGVEEVFWRVAIKPGKPVSFGVRGDTLVFGLPGNPVSALVGCELFVKPALRALQATTDPRPRFQPGRLGESLRRNEARDDLVRARTRVDGDAIVLDPLAGQESHMIARAAGADALVHVPRGAGEVAAGASVSWLQLGEP
jgi:molybdopterin molybdotransferase